MKQLRDYQRIALNECINTLKKDNEPVLLMASVGAGKSLILSELLLLFQKTNKRALCIVNNAELVRSNAQTFKEQGGSPSIYCSSLNSKDSANKVVFGTPQSVLSGIKRNDTIASIKFNIIVVDEAHCINYLDIHNSFMRILRHYRQEYPDMRVLGATGTNFRYKGEPITGESCLFKTQVGNISTSWLIEQNYLIKPKFEVDDELTIDFSSVKLNQMGKFDNKQLETVIEKNNRLTSQIIKHVVHIMESQNRFGCFIFCSTLKHCEEAALELPTDKTAIITGQTCQKERTVILDKARKGEIKYLINVQVLTVGIDVPGFDTLLFLRPTESLVLAVQMIGRALRLYPGKKEALILDCAGNLDRHSHWDDPIMLDALKQTRDKDKPLIFPCPICATMNTEHARRCVGIVNKKRCDWYFEWKDCPQCNKQVDITSRNCPYCQCELIDPNAKLSVKPFKQETFDVEVIKSKFWVQEHGKYTQLRAIYQIKSGLLIYECYNPTSSEKAKNVFYGQFVKPCVKNSSFWYPHLQNPIYLKSMLNQIQAPDRLIIKKKDHHWIVVKKIYQEQDNQELLS
jgi:DNA repair protein RadD